MERNIVILSKNDLQEACEIANARMDGVCNLKLNDKHGAEGGRNLEYHLLGARGEVAFKKYIGCHQKLTVNTFRSTPDVLDFEVRTRRDDSYDLILRKDDPDHKIYVLVVGNACRYRVVGWIKGSERYDHEPKSFNDRPKAWFIPQSALHRIEELQF